MKALVMFDKAASPSSSSGTGLKIERMVPRVGASPAQWRKWQEEGLALAIKDVLEKRLEREAKNRVDVEDELEVEKLTGFKVRDNVVSFKVETREMEDGEWVKGYSTITVETRQR